ncbi:MAG: dicarboxylate/amino acid:cation symporter [Zetaproteobacteria bacterium]|nr:dicarboxylate/amino acid:cation symporter [Zetaproteobacteria bacterium]
MRKTLEILFLGCRLICAGVSSWGRLFSAQPDWAKIMTGLVLGAFSGWWLGPQAIWSEPLGQVFLNAIMSLVGPVVFVSLVVGMTSVQDTRKMGRVLLRGLGLYFVSMLAFAALALVCAQFIFKPGTSSYLRPDLLQGPSSPQLQQVSVVDFFLGLVPKNIFAAFVDGNILQIIFCALIFGLSLHQVGEKAEPVRVFFVSLSQILYRAVMLIMKAAPYGVFAITHHVVGTQGLEVLRSLLYFVFVLYVCAFGGMLGIYSLGLLCFGLPPGAFFKKIFAVQTIAFSTASSAACLPTNMTVCQQKLGISHSVASFLLPLGASMNMNGLSCYMGVVAVFAANLYGIPLSYTDMVTVVFTSAIASMGCAGVPAAGLFVMPAVLSAVGLPLEVIGLVAAVDRLIDMMTTTVNITGDSFAAILVAKSEGELDDAVYIGSAENVEPEAAASLNDCDSVLSGT